MIKGEWVLPTLNFISEKIHKKENAFEKARNRKKGRRAFAPDN